MIFGKKNKNSNYSQDNGYYDDNAYDDQPVSMYSQDGIRERAERLRLAESQRKEDDRREYRDWERRSKQAKRQKFLKKHHKGLIKLCVIVGIIAVLAITCLFLYVSYDVTDIQVTGNTMRTDEQIADIVCSGTLGRNPLYLSLKYKDKSVTDVPFVEKMTVSVLSPHSIKVTVYEKALAGYVSYLGTYMYFARDGTVVEASDEKVEGIPEVTGLSFDHIMLHEQLPVKDDSVFNRILDVTQLLNKYKLDVDRLYFDSLENLTLFYGDVRINLGQDEYTDEKISNLSHILPELTGRSGTIDLTNYTPDQQNISFTEKSN